MAHCDPEWMELREFYCPKSGRLLEVEAVTSGYPVVHDFLPDIEGFYRGWLGRELAIDRLGPCGQRLGNTSPGKSRKPVLARGC